MEECALWAIEIQVVNTAGEEIRLIHISTFGVTAVCQLSGWLQDWGIHRVNWSRHCENRSELKLVSRKSAV